MSRGHGGYAKLIDYDDTLVIYSYRCYSYNIEDDEYKNNMKKIDGEIYIDRDVFVEPEIRKKIKKMNTGRIRKKEIITRIKKDVPLIELLETEKIRVKNASGTWEKNNLGIDIIAFQIIYEIFDKYQEIGKIPKEISIYY